MSFNPKQHMSKSRVGARTPVSQPMYRNSKLHAQKNTIQRNIGVLEKTGRLVPQGAIVKLAKFGWNLVWKIFMNELAPQSKDGMYMRPGYRFDQRRIGDEEFPVVPLGSPHHNYVLFLGNPCPWCHRVAMAAELRGLVGTIVDVVPLVDDPERASRGGWVFDSVDPYFGYSDLRQVYDGLCGLDEGFKGRCTAPLLVDTVSKKIISNESSDIVEMFDVVHMQGLTSDITLRPAPLCQDIDMFNNRIFDKLNNGVYKCGFSTEQGAYETAYADLYETLKELDDVLSMQHFLLGEKFTDADLRVFATAARFDAVYSSLFRCIHRLSDFPNIHRWFLECARLPLPGGNKRVLADTIDIDDCRRSYYSQLFPLNPGGIVPSGPVARDVLHPGTSVHKSNDILEKENGFDYYYYGR